MSASASSRAQLSNEPKFGYASAKSDFRRLAEVPAVPEALTRLSAPQRARRRGPQAHQSPHNAHTRLRARIQGL